MFIGRGEEKQVIIERIENTTFEFGILYGRRRIGKTTLLKNILEERKGIYFVASEMDFTYNLEAFSRVVAIYFDEPVTFDSLEMLFAYLNKKSQQERLIVVIDEFTYLFAKEKGIESMFQNIIDHTIEHSNMVLILSGSQVGMIEDVISYSRPLYGRLTFKMKLEAFDYYDAALFYPNFSTEDKIIAYSIFGGIPHYLSRIDDDLPIKENVIKLLSSKNADFKDEINFFLKQELRSISAYGMIISAIAGGATKLNEVAQRAQIKETGTATKYINTLRDLNIIEKEVCFGERENSKKTIYKIKDNLFHFYYLFIQKNKSQIAMTDENYFYDTFIKPNLDTYVGHKFEIIAKQYLIRKNKENLTNPFIEVARYWGNNKELKREVEIDLVVKGKNTLVVYECKWTNDLFRLSEVNNLRKSANHLHPTSLQAFSKSGYSDEVKNALDKAYILDDLFN
ncbi:MAG: ATP-binding protein [Bacilli bacterium]